MDAKGLIVILTSNNGSSSTSEICASIPNKAGVKKELLDTVKARELAYYSHTMRKQGSCLEIEIMQGTMPVARR